MRYRRDIDGLRGLAVMLVVAYHAGFPWMQGGFVGVDVFFVISGFVITALLEERFTSDGFSPADFYLHRFRRIYPALLLVLTVTLLAGVWLLGPFDLSQLAAAALAVLALSANIYFWRQRDYFADQAPPHALLHTWSLGVEEQFYLLFPLLLMFAKGSSQWRRKLVLIVLAISLAVDLWLTGTHPAAAFYLMPGRAWEFCLGSLIAMKPPRMGALPAEMLSALGLMLILVAAVLLSGAAAYPGVAALLPGLGAAALIAANSAESTASAKLLRSGLFWRVGLASYSVYLWHWPVLTLSRHWLGRDLALGETLAAFALIAVLSMASWKWVELRFRGRGTSAGNPAPLASVLLVGTLLAAGAVLTLLMQGFPARIPAAARAYDRSVLSQAGGTPRCHRGLAEFSAGKVVCPLTIEGPPAVMLWGDSHANALSPVLADLARKAHASIWQATYSSCPPLIGVDVAHTPSGHRCKQFNEHVLQSIKDLNIRRVVLAGYWNYYASPKPTSGLVRALDPYGKAGSLGSGDTVENQRIFAAALSQTVDKLRRMGVDVWIVDQIPVQREFVPDAIARAAIAGAALDRLGVPRIDFDRERRFVHEQLGSLGGAAHIIDPAAPLCASGVCVLFSGGNALYVDAHHLSAAGAGLIGGAFAQIFQSPP